MRYWIALLLFSSGFQAFANECNEISLINSYIDYRKALLAINFSKVEVLKTLKPEYESNIKNGYLGVHLVALRKAEARILKINKYFANCTSNKEGILYADIFHEQSEYKINVIYLKNYGHGFVVTSTSLESEKPK